MGKAGDFTSTFVVEHLVIHGGGDTREEVPTTLATELSTPGAVPSTPGVVSSGPAVVPTTPGRVPKRSRSGAKRPCSGVALQD